MKLVIAGGGTGGHLFPGIAVAEEFLSRDTSNQVLFVGSERGIEARAVPAAGYRLETVSARGIRGKGSLSQLIGGAMMLYAYAQSRKILKKFQPDMVLGVGGYASLPMVLAAKGMQIPRFIHEQNAIPGKTNILLSRFVRQVYITLEESARFFPEGRILLTGNPLRRQILDNISAGIGISGPESATREPGEPFNLLVFGGSQGAHAINMAMIDALPRLAQLKNQLRIVHQTGENDLAAVETAYREHGITATVQPFISSMGEAYRTADLIVCRAGATTIAEVTACGKACIFIPFPHATDDHQRKNAEALLKKGAGFVLLEKELGNGGLANTIIELFHDPETLQRTSACAFGLARIDAAGIIVDRMLEEVTNARD